MRILHTSDWHLGKSIHGQDLHEDQSFVLGNLVDELRNGYDALIIAGDIYDRAVPPAEAISLFSSFIEKMVDLRIVTIVIPGNHDSGSRLDFASGVLERSGIHFRCRLDRIVEPVVIEDQKGNSVQVFALPFVDEIVVKAMYPDAGIRTHQDATEYLVDLIRKDRDPSIPSILVAHAYTGREPMRSESERELLIGNQGLVDIDIFRDFDHVALGHLHRPQTPSKTSNIHYSGSLMTYSFSEADHTKSYLVLEMVDDRFQVSRFDHRQKRDFNIVKGDLSHLLRDGSFDSYIDDYLSVELTDKGYLMDIHRKLSERYPHILEIDQPALHSGPTGSGHVTREQADDPSKLFSMFLDRFRWEDEKDRSRAVELFDGIRKELSDDDREVIR